MEETCSFSFSPGSLSSCSRGASKVEGKQGAAVHFELIDRHTGHVVTSGPESSAKLEIVTLEGDFNGEDWSQEEFESHVVKEREGKRPLLTGNLHVTLKEGVGTPGDLKFTDNSSWTRSRKFRLGLKVASGHCEGIRIREAKTEAFIVKDHRGELYKKHYPPALIDEVWRLEKIGKDGSFHKRLNHEELFTVEDFLRLLVRDPQKLRNVLGSGMSNKMWDALREHARTCELSGKFYVYYYDDAKSIGVSFNCIFEPSGLVTRDQFYPADSLSGCQKADMDTWVKKAYDNWNQVVEYDGEPKSMLNFKQSSTSQNCLPLGPVTYPNSLNSQLPPQGLAESVLSEPSLVDPSMLVGGSEYHHGSCSNFVSATLTQHNQPLGVSYETQSRAFDLPQSSSQANINPFQDWSNNRATDINDFFDGLLENEEMQDLIGGNASINENEYGAGPRLRALSFGPYSRYSRFGYGNSMDPGSGNTIMGWLKIKAAMRWGIFLGLVASVIAIAWIQVLVTTIMGWLKIKATMRWGIFLRRKAAERRAQVVQLEDE